MKRRIPLDFELPNYLSKDQKDSIVYAIKNDIPILIKGKLGPTGKTYLANKLREIGTTVYEESECTVVKLDTLL